MNSKEWAQKALTLVRNGSVLALRDGECAGHPAIAAAGARCGIAASDGRTTRVEIDDNARAVQTVRTLCEAHIAEQGDEVRSQIVNRGIACRAQIILGYGDVAYCVEAVHIDAAIAAIGRRHA